MESGDPATAAGLLLLDLVEQQQARNADAYCVNYTVFSSHSPPRTNFVAPQEPFCNFDSYPTHITMSI